MTDDLITLVRLTQATAQGPKKTSKPLNQGQKVSRSKVAQSATRQARKFKPDTMLLFKEAAQQPSL